MSLRRARPRDDGRGVASAYRRSASKPCTSTLFIRYGTPLTAAGRRPPHRTQPEPHRPPVAARRRPAARPPRRRAAPASPGDQRARRTGRRRRATRRTLRPAPGRIHLRRRAGSTGATRSPADWPVARLASSTVTVRSSGSPLTKTSVDHDRARAGAGSPAARCRRRSGRGWAGSGTTWFAQPCLPCAARGCSGSVERGVGDPDGQDVLPGDQRLGRGSTSNGVNAPTCAPSRRPFRYTSARSITAPKRSVQCPAASGR